LLVRCSAWQRLTRRRQIVRDVSDEDGLVGKFQANAHEVMHRAAPANGSSEHTRLREHAHTRVCD
jgi:hypothetical protein